MVALVVEGSIPMEIFHWYLEVLGESFGLGAEHIPPAFAFIESQSFGILTAQRYDHRPYIAAVVIQLIRHLIQLYIPPICISFCCRYSSNSLSVIMA